MKKRARCPNFKFHIKTPLFFLSYKIIIYSLIGWVYKIEDATDWGATVFSVLHSLNVIKL